MTVEATLCYLRRNGKVLLQRKRWGLFGGGKYNAPGGKLEPGEDPRRGAAREVSEETGLKVQRLHYHGILRFYRHRLEKPEFIVHVFSTDCFEGQLQTGKEGELRWFKEAQIPFDLMWPDDEHWVPLLLAGKNFHGNFYFDKRFTKLLRQSIVTEPLATSPIAHQKS